MINLVIPYNEHLLKIFIYITSRVIPNFLWTQIVYTKNVQVCIFTIHSFSLFYNIFIVWQVYLSLIMIFFLFYNNYFYFLQRIKSFVFLFDLFVFLLLLQGVHLQLLIQHILFYSFYPRYSLKVSNCNDN